IFHFLVTTSSLYIADKLQDRDKKPDVTQIEIIEEPAKESLQDKLEKTKQIIKQLKANVEVLNDAKKIARFDSEQTQRVQKETKATQLGVSQNAAASQLNQLLQQKSLPTSVPAQKPTEDTDGNLPEFTKARPNVQQMPVAQNSSISSNLPNDIENSNATNLNTDANTYYSFYSRIEDLFYVRWVERVSYYWDRISYDYKKNVLSGKVWSTTVEIWLSSTGEFHSAYIKQPSGYKAFDESAVFSFKDAKFFPNPPKAKVEADGFVRLRYRFNILVDAN
ncbi:MAG: TonB family protein, partial [Pseudobdellovibrio sp.]